MDLNQLATSVCFDSFVKFEKISDNKWYYNDCKNSLFFVIENLKKLFYICHNEALLNKNSISMNNLGYLYANGFAQDTSYNSDKFIANYKFALKYFLESSKLQNTFAMNNIANLYYNGHGVIKNHQTAFEWYVKSSTLGNSYAFVEIGNMYYNSSSIDIIKYKYAYDNFILAKKLGNSIAMILIANLYVLGRGNKIDYKSAYENLLNASERHNAEAFIQLGLFNEYGIGGYQANAFDPYGNFTVIRNYNNAYIWYNSAARSGNKTALTHLAILYNKTKEKAILETIISYYDVYPIIENIFGIITSEKPDEFIKNYKQITENKINTRKRNFFTSDVNYYKRIKLEHCVNINDILIDNEMSDILLKNDHRLIIINKKNIQELEIDCNK